MDVKGDGALPNGAGAHSSDAIAALKTKAVVPRTADVRWSGMMSPVRFAADGPPIEARQDGRCQCARYAGEETPRMQSGSRLSVAHGVVAGHALAVQADVNVVEHLGAGPHDLDGAHVAGSV